jgi:bifunctional DNA-binding transcriptional regulator/antitoxin component of YhaV-PrlF toxin-antitoxin module
VFTKRQDIRAEDEMAEVSRVGAHGMVIIPPELRQRYGIEEGSVLVVEAREEGVLFRPTSELPANEEQQRFLLETEQAYAELRADPAAWEAELRERALLDGTLLDGLDPDEIWTDADFVDAGDPPVMARDEP